MEDIAKASRVSAGTLYNRFGTKEGLIAAALLDYFDAAVGSLVASHKADTPVAILIYGLDITAHSVLQAPHFSRALMATYFRPGTDHIATDHLTQRVFETWLPVLERMRQQGSLARWADVARLNTEICDRLFGVVVKWAQGKIPDAALRNAVTFSILLLLHGASKGRQATEIETLLQALAEPPDAASAHENH